MYKKEFLIPQTVDVRWKNGLIMFDGVNGTHTYDTRGVELYVRIQTPNRLEIYAVCHSSHFGTLCTHIRNCVFGVSVGYALFVKPKSQSKCYTLVANVNTYSSSSAYTILRQHGKLFVAHSGIQYGVVCTPSYTYYPGLCVVTDSDGFFIYGVCKMNVHSAGKHLV